MLCVIVHLQVRPERSAEFRKAMVLNAAESRKEAGCLQFDVSQAPDDAASLTLYEIYTGHDAFDAHRQTHHYKEWRVAADRCVLERRTELRTLISTANTAPHEPQVIHLDGAPTVDRGHGVQSRYMVTTTLGPVRFMSGTTEFAVGAALPMHYHNCDESVVVLKGDARFDYGANSASLSAGDATWVPCGTPHRFVNAGEGSLQILWFYGRADATRTLSETGETVPIVPPT